MVIEDKYAQVTQILREKNIGLWLLMGRETVDVCDPGLRLVLPTNIMGVSAFFFTPDGRRRALVRKKDVGTVQAVNVFDEVVGYGDDFDERLRATIEAIDPNVIDVNVDLYDALTDGLTAGLYLRLLRDLEGTPYAGRISLGEAIRAIRGRKAPGEIAQQREVLKLLNQVCAELQDWVKVGQTTEEDVYDYCQAFMKRHGLVGSWENSCCPLVHAGARSNQGLVHPGRNPILPGDTFHLSFGAKKNGYATDFQRIWYVLKPGEREAPEEVRHAFESIRGTIETVRTAMRPGIEGRQVDDIASSAMAQAGFVTHGCGHAVGMALHDGCFQLCQDTPVLGDLPARRLEEGNVFTLEFFCDTPCGVVAMEEMIVLTDHGGEYVYKPQTELWMLKSE